MGYFTLKEQIIMVYLNCENPIVETTINRDINVGDIVKSEYGVIYELIYISEIKFENSIDMVVLQDISRRNSFLVLPYDDIINDLKISESKNNYFYKFEKIAYVLNSVWKGEN